MSHRCGSLASSAVPLRYRLGPDDKLALLATAQWELLEDLNEPKALNLAANRPGRLRLAVGSCRIGRKYAEARETLDSRENRRVVISLAQPEVAYPAAPGVCRSHTEAALSVNESGQAMAVPWRQATSSA
jgi:hypothetical protein